MRMVRQGLPWFWVFPIESRRARVSLLGDVIVKLEDQKLVRAPRAVVFAALNDPDVLRQCIPGCETLIRESDTQLSATVALKIGPVAARFAGSVTLSDVDAPNGYTISGEGKGGAAGFAKGGARVALRDVPEGTMLAYDASAEVGGKLAQLGARLIDQTARKLSGDFFARFAEIVEAQAASLEPVAAPVALPDDQAAMPEEVTQSAATGGIPLWALGLGLAVLVIGYWLLSQ